MPNDDSRSRNGDHTPDSADDVIISEATAAPGARKPPPTTLTPHDLATPYVLDALELDEREAFERHLINCHACQVRVADLEEAALLLPDALVAPPADLPDAFPFLLRDVAHETLPFTNEEPALEDAAEPDAEHGEYSNVDPGFTPVSDPPDETMPAAIEPPQVDPVNAPDEAAAAVAESPAVERNEPPPKPKLRSQRPEPTPPPDAIDDYESAAPARASRPPGRIRPGVRPQQVVSSESPGGSHGGFQITPAVAAALALGLLALGLFLWALLLLGRVGDLEDELDQQNQEITALRQQANATAYTLTPTSNGPEGASGTFFFSLPDQQGALVVRGLDPAPNGWAYQMWFINDDESTPSSGQTFQVDENGDAVVPLTADVATFDAVAISIEPAGGSPAPTSQLILQGRLGGAAG